jgi:hypothetical protein
MRKLSSRARALNLADESAYTLEQFNLATNAGIVVAAMVLCGLLLCLSA